MNEKELSEIEKENQELALQSQMILKVIDILNGKVIVSNEEIDELIIYFQEMEKYIICDRLKKVKKI